MDRAKLPEAAGSGTAKKRRKARGGLECRQINGFWWVYGTLRLDGRSHRIRKSLGIAADRPQHEAEAARAKLEGQAIAESVFGVRQSRDFGTVVLAWHSYADPGPIDIFISKRLTRYFGTKLVRDITASDIGGFVLTMSGRKPSTINRSLNTLHAILAVGVRMGWVDSVPHIERPRVRKSTVNKMLSFNEIEGLLECAVPHVAGILALMAVTGCRVGEAVYLQIADVILADGRERVIFRDTKNGETYGAPLHQFAVPYLASAIGKRQTGAVFLTDKGREYAQREIGGGQIKKGFAGARKRLIERLVAEGHLDRAKIVALATPHWLRHSFASHLMAQGESVKTIMDAGRWKTARLVMETYGHLAPDATRRAVAAMQWGSQKADDKTTIGKKKA